MSLSPIPIGPAPAAWWRQTPLLERFVSDFIHAELCLMRRSGAGLPPQPWHGQLRLEDDLGVDSLEANALAMALASCLHMGDSGMDGALRRAATLAEWCDAVRASQEPGGTKVRFRTSGSSGVPKNCDHRLDLLWQEAAFFAAQLPLARRILYAVPAHHIYGFLFTVLLPMAARHSMPSAPPLTLLDARRMLPSELLRHAAEGDVIVGYPEFWAAAAAAAASGPGWPAGVTGVTSTAPCPPELAGTLAAGGLRLLEIYGSSETAGVGWRSEPGRPYALLPYWRRSADGVLERDAPGGGVHGCELQDVIDWLDGHTFMPSGRRDHAVQVGGVNVYPAQVSALLKRHPGVRDAQVRLMRADEGTRLKAFVVPSSAGSDQDGLVELAGQLAQWVRTQLPPAARPVSFTMGAALPATPQGKLADWIIADAGVCAAAPASTERFAGCVLPRPETS